MHIMYVFRAFKALTVEQELLRDLQMKNLHLNHRPAKRSVIWTHVQMDTYDTLNFVCIWCVFFYFGMIVCFVFTRS